MPRLARVASNRATSRDALACRKRRVVFDVVDQQVECILGVGLNQLQLGEWPRELSGRKKRACDASYLVSLNVVPVLDLIQTVLRLALIVVAFSRSINCRLISTRLVLDRQQGVHSAGYRDQGFLDLAGGLNRLHAGVNTRNIFFARDIVIVPESSDIGLIGRIESLLPLTRGHLPEGSPVVQPQRSCYVPCSVAKDDVGWITSVQDILCSLTGGVERSWPKISCIGQKVRDGGRETNQNVGPVGIDKGAFPIHAAVEQVGSLLDGAPNLVAAVGGTHGIGVADRMMVICLGSTLSQLGALKHVIRPLGKRLTRVVVEEVDIRG